MERKVFIIMITVLLLTGCGSKPQKSNLNPKSVLNKKCGNTPLENKPETIMTIVKRDKICVPVMLEIYKDGSYELFTAYEVGNPNEVSNLILKYTESIKGKTDYDILKIIEDESMKEDSMNNFPEYEIYLGNYYVEKGYEYNYEVERGKENKTLQEFLEKIEVDLDACATPDYSIQQ